VTHGAGSDKSDAAEDSRATALGAACARREIAEREGGAPSALSAQAPCHRDCHSRRAIDHNRPALRATSTVPLRGSKSSRIRAIRPIGVRP